MEQLIKVYLANSMFTYSSNWNIVLLLLAICSVIAVTVFIERLVQLQKREIDTHAFMLQMKRSLENRNIVEAIEVCENSRGSIAHIVKAGLLKHEKSKSDIESAMQRRGLLEIALLEKHAKVLSIIAHIAPLIGLLGTVLGFIQAFSEMRLSGLVDISATKIGEAMEYALVTTAAGLAVAIPSVIAYNYLVSRLESFILEVQTTSSEVVDLLLEAAEYD